MNTGVNLREMVARRIASLSCCSVGFDLVEKEVRDFFVHVCKGFDEFRASLLGEGFDVVWDLVFGNDCFTTRTFRIESLHPDKVDDAAEAILCANWDLYGRSVDLELVVDLVDGFERVGAHAVHLVDEGYSGHIVSSHLPVHCYCLRLNA